MPRPIFRTTYASRYGEAARVLLAVAAITLTGGHRCFAQAPPAASAPPPSTAVPAPSAAIAAVIADAQAKVKAGRFAEAVAALTAAKTDGLPPDDKQALDFAIADAQAAWGYQLCDSKQLPNALTHFQIALNIDRSSAARRSEFGSVLGQTGLAYDFLGQYEKAVYYLNEAARVDKEIKAEDSEASALTNLGITYNQLRQYDRAIPYFEQSLPIFRKVKNRAFEANVLNSLGVAYDQLAQSDRALMYHSQALQIYREVKDVQGELNALTSMQNACNRLGEFAKSVIYYKQTLEIFRQVKDRDSEGGTINDLGSAYRHLKQYNEAIKCYEEALIIHREVKNRPFESIALNNLGLTYDAKSQFEKALSYYQQALIIDRELENEKREAVDLTNMGFDFGALSQFKDAIECSQKALSIFKNDGNRKGELSALSSLGLAYSDLGQYEKAITYLQQSLAISQMMNDQEGVAGTLGNLGLTYNGLHQFKRAITTFEQAAPIYLKIKDLDGEAGNLVNLGITYNDLKRYETAIAYFNRGLAILRKGSNQEFQANALADLGDSYRELYHFDEAVKNIQQSLLIFSTINVRNGEAAALESLMESSVSTKNPKRNANEGIFYGKRAVNVLQRIRSDNRKLDNASQKTYLRSNEDIYHTLADLLISQGRLPEAQQVLGLLKEHEFFDFVRRDAAEASGMGKADLTALEREADARIEAQGDSVTALAASYDALAAKHERTQAEQKQMDALRPKLQAARDGFEKTLQNLTVLFAAHHGTVAQQQDVNIKDSPALARTLHALKRDTRQTPVAVYTLVGDKTLRFLVYTTNGSPVARKYPIGASDLRRLVYAFRSALQDPMADPRPLGKRLYNILIGPVARDLDGAKATEVMWSLDDALRYLPIAALSPDGVHYVIEDATRRHSIFTPATLTSAALTGAPARDWSALAMGVSKAHVVKTVTGEDDFHALPGVPAEVNGIVKAAGAGANGGPGGTGTGVLPGTILLDEKFTRASLERTLEDGHGQFPVVHIASHFNFRPGGDDGSSYLLLGDGTPLSLADIKGLSSNLFADVDLLTLSACDTATGGNAGESAAESSSDSSDPGAEVESFGTLAQRAGASAVLASLWPVSDASTPVLMREFYLLRQAHPDLPKAEALRQAQIALLTGRAGASAKPRAAKRSDLLASPPKAASNDAPPAFMPNSAKPWAHPYYWAPFILIGNWK